MIKVKLFRQTPGLCGPASLKMVLDFYGKEFSEKELARASGYCPEQGTNPQGILSAAKKLGFQGLLREKSSLDELEAIINKGIPVIVDWFWEDEGHYSVVVGFNKKNIILADPSLKRLRKMEKEKFLRVWFDFEPDFMKTEKDLILRMMIVVFPKEKKDIIENVFSKKTRKLAKA